MKSSMKELVIAPTSRSSVTRLCAGVASLALAGAVLSVPANAAAGAAADRTGYRPVCQDTVITDRPDGEARLVVPDGERVNVRRVEGDHAHVNYPARGWVETRALCS